MKRKFNTIKKSRKKSKDIDEKIEYLNKECQKTGLQEIMTTTGMYSVVQTIPDAPADIMIFLFFYNLVVIR